MNQPSDKNDFYKKYSDLLSETFQKISNPLAACSHFIFSKNRFSSRLNSVALNIYFDHKNESKVEPINQNALAFKFVFRLFVLSIVSKIILFKNLKKLAADEHKKYVIKTFAYEHSFKDKKFIDPFFTVLSEHLKSKNRWGVVTVFDPVGGQLRSIREARQVEGVFPYFIFLKTTDFLLLLKNIFFNFVPNIKVNFLNLEITEQFQKIWKYESTELDSIHALSIFYAFKNFFIKYQTDFLTHTYENNPWEKCLNYACQQYSKTTKIIGYQHSIVTEASFNVFIQKNEYEKMFFPQKILTVGKIPAEIILERSNLNSNIVQPACALRYQYLEKIELKNKPLDKTILVALEGVRPVVYLIEFAIRQAAEMPDYTFIVRTHPALRWKELQTLIQFKGKMPGNIQFSETCELIEDLNRTSIVLYWGSTVALEALKIGNPCISLISSTVFSLDPLFLCNELKENVQNHESILPIINRWLTLNAGELKTKRINARNYIENYFHAIQSQAMDKWT